MEDENISIHYKWLVMGQRLDNELKGSGPYGWIEKRVLKSLIFIFTTFFIFFPTITDTKVIFTYLFSFLFIHT